MSTLVIASTSTPSCLRRRARWADPTSPCSSPATATKYRATAGCSLAKARASSSAIAVPLASSTAPGASLCASITSDGMLS